MNFVSIAPKQIGGADAWSKYILDHLSSLDDEFVIFTLEDFFPTASPNLSVIRGVLSLMKKDKIVGRFDLTYDSFTQGQYKLLKERKNLSLISKDKFTQYRISTQPAIWRREFLIEILKKTTTPWDFEINGSKLSNSMDQHILAFADPTFEKFPTYWIHKGAVSRSCPGKINVLGLDVETIREMSSIGLFKEENLVWGMWNSGKIPTFYEMGGYDFDLNNMPINEASRSNWAEYRHIYDKDKLVVNLFDQNFSHTMQLFGYVTSNGNNFYGCPKTIQYELRKAEHNGVTIFTDHYMNRSDIIKSVKSDFKVAWICEPRNIHPFAYQGLESNISLFDLVITWDEELIRKYDNCKLLPVMETRVAKKDCMISRKTKLVSLIASTKKTTFGHKYRFEIKERLAEKYNIDLWGSAFKKFENKTEPLQNYCFSIVVLNNKIPNLFTEALIDCFLLGTIPILWGCTNVEEFFDKRGILTFDTIEDLEEIMLNLSHQRYIEMLPHVKNNFNKSLKYQTTKDDQIREHLKKELGI